MTWEIPVDTPNFWWRARAGELRNRLRDDVDYEDIRADTRRAGKPEFESEPELDWDVITKAVIFVGEQLARKQWYEDPDAAPDSTFVYVRLSCPQMTRAEYRLVCSWFGAAQPVRADAWESHFFNGRHRSHQVSSRACDELIPVQSHTLSSGDPANWEDLGPAVAKDAQDGCTRLPQVTWFDENDPLNRTFVDCLESAAGGKRPPFK